MNANTLLYTCLVFHICGFATLTGALLADFSIHSRLGKRIKTDRPVAFAILDGAAGIPPLLIAGTLLAILSGVGMMVALKGAPGEMLWMKIKFPLVIVLLLNAIIMARPSGNKLKKLLHPNHNAPLEEIMKVRNRIKWFHITQALILLTIFILSAFKF